MAKQYWLMKTEPNVYSIDDLARERTSIWEGVRNYQARNFMRDTMKIGDIVLFYHSNAKPSGVVGIARVCREGYPDFTAQDPKSRYFDPKSTKDNPIWSMVDVEFIEKLPRTIALAELKQKPELEGMILLQKGSRLSVHPVEKQHFEFVCNLAKQAVG